MSNIITVSSALTVVAKKYGIDNHKLHLLALIEGQCGLGSPLRVTDLIKKYAGTSPATTHKAIKELVGAKLVKEVDSKHDKREKFLHPGSKFSCLEKDFGVWL